MSLTDPANRESYRADEQAYMTQYELSGDEIALVARRDWAGLIERGGGATAIGRAGLHELLERLAAHLCAHLQCRVRARPLAPSVKSTPSPTRTHLHASGNAVVEGPDDVPEDVRADV